MATAVALFFALAFYALTAWGVRRARRLIGRTPLAVLRSGGIEMKLAVAAMQLVPLVLVVSTLRPDVPWLRPVVDRPAYRVAAAVLFGGGLLLQAAAMRALGASFRIGIDPERPGPLVREGPYRVLRHPIYAAFMAFFVAAWLLQPNVLFGVVAPLGILRLYHQATVEERELLRRFGADYAAYARTTSRFIPFVW